MVAAPVRPFILASLSPRRRALLQQVGCEFEVRPAPIVESQPRNGELPAEYARRCAEEKALAVSRQTPHMLVLGADTVVAVGRSIIGKPTDEEEACRILSKLSGRSHRVHTGIAVAHRGEIIASETVSTRVRFRRLSPSEIQAYVATREPLDKAGAYGIQGRGALLVEEIDGCYYNVVGLPLSRAIQLLNTAEHAIDRVNGEGPC